MSRIFNLSGGLVYHYTSLKYKSKLWSEARQSLTSMLSQSLDPTIPLVLVGASGGYMLSRSWLNSFPSIVYNDIDPIAQFIFKKQKANANTRYDMQNYLGAPAHIQRLFERYPNHQFLFCNILGQLSFVFKDQNWKHNPKSCIDSIKNFAPPKRVFSFHELYSWHASNSRTAQSVLSSHSGTQQNDRFLKVLESTQKNQKVSEHISAHEFPHKIGYFLWPRTPRYIHHIELVMI